MTGALAVSGELRSVRGLVQRIEAAASVGYRAVIVPAAAKAEILLDPEVEARIEVVYVRNLADVLAHVLAGPATVVEALALRLRVHNGNGTHIPALGPGPQRPREATAVARRPGSN